MFKLPRTQTKYKQKYYLFYADDEMQSKAEKNKKKSVQNNE